MVMESNGWRYSSYNRFSEYWKHYFPGLRTTRMASDACDSCVRIEVALQDPDLTPDEKNSLILQKTMHLEGAKDQRRFMNRADMACLQSWTPDELADLKGIDFVPELLDADVDIEDVKVIENEGSKLRNVVVQCEDFGQSIAMPHYGYKQPGLDYFNSNLMMHEFVVADRVSNTNKVYFYDEQILKKDGESMCNLRLIDHLSLLKQYIAADVPLPKNYISIMDNCCGQNKSKLVFMLFNLLSILFYDNICLNFLLPGHSHMAADRVVSWIRTSLGKSNIYIPEQLFNKVNDIKNTKAIDVSKFGLVKGFNGIFKKYFKEMPVGYTKYYYFEMSNGVCTFKFHAEHNECYQFVFCHDIFNTRKAIMRELFGSTDVRDIIIRQNILLEPYGRIKLPDSKL